MQALTIAIGPAGINFFTGQLVTNELLTAVSGLKLPDRTLSVDPFSAPPPAQANWWDIQIVLSNAKLNNFSPSLKSPESPVQQQPQGQFQLVFTASNFSAYYAWHETGQWEYSSRTGTHGPYPFDNHFDYTPGVGQLTVTVTLGFVYTGTSYDIDVVSSSTDTSGISPNIPEHSILQNQQSTGWFSSTVSDATAQAVDNINLSQLISTLIPPSLLHSIPASGQLTPDIRYEFGLGDSGLTFPKDQGIAIGATGRVSYKGQYYPGTPGKPPPVLPLPPVPASTDTHHLQVYVSDYEVNALHWAFFQAGLLNVTVQPKDFPDDPDILAVATYASWIPAFEPYTNYVMQAQVNPKQPPGVTFEQVYQFTAAAMQVLQPQLPSDIYQAIANSALAKTLRAYVSAADLKADLTALFTRQKLTPTQQNYQDIEKATGTMGMVVTQDLEFTLTIQDGSDQPPNLVFDVQRTDILEDLGLGESGSAQTLKYSFTHVYGKYAATFVSTTVPDFTDGDSFGKMIWPGTGEPKYDEALSYMGQKGVPLPIMAGFQFLFDDAVLSIQQSYVSILAQVAFKGTTLLKGASHE